MKNALTDGARAEVRKGLETAFIKHGPGGRKRCAVDGLSPIDIAGNSDGGPLANLNGQEKVIYITRVGNDHPNMLPFVNIKASRLARRRLPHLHV